MNIYIRPDLEKRLREEDSMSGLINKLLDKHYTPLPPSPKTIKRNPEAKNIFQPKETVSEDKANFTFCPNGHPKVGDKCLGKICKYN